MKRSEIRDDGGDVGLLYQVMGSAYISKTLNIPKMVFCTPCGKYEYTHMPFG